MESKAKLSKSQFVELASSVVTAIAMILLAFGVLSYEPAALGPPVEIIVPDNAAEARGTTHFSGLNVTGAVDLDSTLNVDGATTLVGAVEAQGDLLVDDTFAIDDTDYALTGTKSLSITASFYELAPTSVLTLTLDTDATADGDILILSNSGSSNAVIVDTGATIGGAAITLGANDTAMFIKVNGKWVMLSTADNS